MIILHPSSFGCLPGVLYYCPESARIFLCSPNRLPGKNRGCLEILARITSPKRASDIGGNICSKLWRDAGWVPRQNLGARWVPKGPPILWAILSARFRGILDPLPGKFGETMHKEEKGALGGGGGLLFSGNWSSRLCCMIRLGMKKIAAPSGLGDFRHRGFSFFCIFFVGILGGQSVS